MHSFDVLVSIGCFYLQALQALGPTFLKPLRRCWQTSRRKEEQRLLQWRHAFFCIAHLLAVTASSSKRFVNDQLCIVINKLKRIVCLIYVDKSGRGAKSPLNIALISCMRRKARLLKDKIYYKQTLEGRVLLKGMESTISAESSRFSSPVLYSRAKASSFAFEDRTALTEDIVWGEM